MFPSQNGFLRAYHLLCIITLVATSQIKGASPIVLNTPEHTLPPGAESRVWGTTIPGLTNLALYFGDQKMAETTVYPPTFIMFFTNDVPGDYQVTVRGTNETGAVVSSDPIVIHYPSRAAARFIFPTNGANVYFGEDIKIQVELILDRGELTWMRIDYPDMLGNYHMDESPPYELVWRAPRPGTYTFSAMPWFGGWGGYGEPAESVTVEILPESVAYITTQPRFYGSVQPGKQFTLGVGSVSRGPQRYQWLRNSVPISGATNDTFIVESATAADDGFYSVIIDNFAGRTSSEFTHVRVAETQPGGGTLLFSNVDLGRDARIITGSTSTFIEAKLVAGPALDQMILYPNRAQIKDGVFDGGVITLSNVPPGGKAFVQLLVERNWEVFVGASKIFEITAGGEQPASLTALESFEAGTNYIYLGLPITIDASNGTNIFAGLTAELKAAPRFSQTWDLTNVWFQWKRNGLPIPGATNRVLRLNNIQLDDSGWYSVIATDWIRTSEVGAAVTVLRSLKLAANEVGEIKLEATPGARYTIESSSDLHTWSFWKSETAVGNELTIPVAPSPSAQLFYRAIAEP